MKSSLMVEASAKINLGLKIGAPGADGYHPLLGIFHSVDISDKLHFSVEAADAIAVSVEGAFDCPTASTTVYMAADRFMRSLGLSGKVGIAVEKRIPAMGGLGGGSADAAATIVALDRLFGTGLGRGELTRLAGQIGSDAPFFISGGAALVSGRGEIIEPIPARNDFGLLLAYPGFGVSTRWAFAELDRFRKGGAEEAWTRENGQGNLVPADRERLGEEFRLPPEKWRFRNDFGAMLYSRYPVYRLLETALRETGALYVSLTGSGSCMYGVYGSLDAAGEAANELKSRAIAGGGEKTLYGMALHATKPLETSLLLG